MRGAKLLRCIGNVRFELELYQLDGGKFCIRTENKAAETEEHTPPMFDFNMANHLFDAKLLKLEGH